ncbi:unnamed protein product [Ilex paraguariensis]|uniref:Uncharacterized protein n=1 Tax=Ilex paraguariensis TaxID=185542 RepID=A0ABC8QUC4_9AQUA
MLKVSTPNGAKEVPFLAVALTVLNPIVTFVKQLVKTDELLVGEDVHRRRSTDSRRAAVLLFLRSVAGVWWIAMGFGMVHFVD